MQYQPPSIPPFRTDGYLPEGLHIGSEAEVASRFGSSTRRRRRLVLRLRRWIRLARQVGARRLLVDGSFVTAKAEPHDIDSVILLPQDFDEHLEREDEPALELGEMLLTRQPEEIFAAEDDLDWEEWVEFFSRTREPDGVSQGARGGTAMIANDDDYRKVQEELRNLENRLDRLQRDHPLGSKGLTKAGVRKLIARLHEELAVYEGSQEARQVGPS